MFPEHTIIAAAVQATMRVGGTPRRSISRASTANPDVTSRADSTATAG